MVLVSPPETPHHQQGTPTTPRHPRQPPSTTDRTPPKTTSCCWARRRSWRRGIGASWTTGSPSRSCWLTARGRPTERKSTTLCSPWPRCDVKTEEEEEEELTTKHKIWNSLLSRRRKQQNKQMVKVQQVFVLFIFNLLVLDWILSRTLVRLSVRYLTSDLSGPHEMISRWRPDLSKDECPAGSSAVRSHIYKQWRLTRKEFESSWFYLHPSCQRGQSSCPVWLRS